LNKNDTVLGNNVPKSVAVAKGKKGKKKKGETFDLTRVDEENQEDFGVDKDQTLAFK
jgi:hypothetical protein